MRTLLRTVLIIAIVGVGILTVLTLSKVTDSPLVVDASIDRSVPEYCVPAELKMIEQELSQNPDVKPGQMLLEKIAANEKAIAECVRLSTAYPPAPKPANLDGVLLPTLTPLPSPEIVMGIQKTILGPSGDFIPASKSENNYWAGVINGETIQILAGIRRERDEKWRENHPEWVNMGPQGAVDVLDSNWKRIALIPTPTRNGYVHFVKECDSLLILQATDGTFFTFDPVKLAFVANKDSCLTTD